VLGDVLTGVNARPSLVAVVNKVVIGRWVVAEDQCGDCDVIFMAAPSVLVASSHVEDCASLLVVVFGGLTASGEAFDGAGALKFNEDGALVFRSLHYAVGLVKHEVEFPLFV
jgi:hypothetical protein